MCIAFLFDKKKEEEYNLLILSHTYNNVSESADSDTLLCNGKYKKVCWKNHYELHIFFYLFILIFILIFFFFFGGGAYKVRTIILY